MMLILLACLGDKVASLNRSSNGPRISVSGVRSSWAVSYTHLICYGMEGREGLYISGKLGACAPFLSFEWEHEGQKFEVNTHLSLIHIFSVFGSMSQQQHGTGYASDTRSSLDNL